MTRSNTTPSEPIFCDYETHYGTAYSIKGITIEEYVRDPRFRAHMIGVQEGRNGTPYVVPHGDILKWHHDVCYYDRFVACHNSKFDQFISRQIYGQVPKMCGDTMAMAMWALGREIPEDRYSLEIVAKHLGVTQKGTGLEISKNKVELTDAEYLQLASYCMTDVTACAEIFYALKPKTSDFAMDLIDWVTKAYLVPTLSLDHGVLDRAHREEILRKQSVLDRLGIDVSQLRSRPKFAAMVESHGVDLPMKISPTTGKETWAFAKTDLGMQKLCRHIVRDVADLANAKLDVGGSGLEKRLSRMMGIANRGGVKSLWPIHLNFCGARNTARLSGGDLVNAQNMQNGTAVREAVTAPPGHSLVVADSNQIELRVSMWMAEQQDMIDALSLGADPYCLMASKIYGKIITKRDNPDERHVGKVCMLALGYGMGFDRFVDQVRNDGLVINTVVLNNAFNTYRTTMDKITHAWQMCEKQLQDVYPLQNAPRVDGQRPHTQYAKYPPFIQPTHQGLLLTPCGFTIKYPNLRRSRGWVYGKKDNHVKLFGGKVFENQCQALTANIIGDQLRILRRRWPIALQAHDELVAVVPTAHAQRCLDDMLDVMSTSPDWWPDIYLGAEGKICQRYSDAK